jgi:carboxyl-terminal processing protease
MSVPNAQYPQETERASSMTARHLYTGFLALVVAGSFAAGLFQKELAAQGGLPEIFSSLRPGGAARELDPLNTYNKVLGLVSERYYGQTDGDMKMTYAAINGLLNALDDPYTRFVDPEAYADLRKENEGTFEGIGATLAGAPNKDGYIRVAKLVPNGPAARAGLKRGDLIAAVNGKSIKGMTTDSAVKIIRGPSNTVVRLGVIRAGQPNQVEIAITRAPVEYPVVEYSMKPGGIGYINLLQFNEMADSKLYQAVKDLSDKGMKGLILDLRGNPGGLLEVAISTVSRFVPQDHGAVIIVESGEREVRKTDPRKYLGGKWPLVVLTNRTSASASEIVAGAVKDNHAGTIIGTTTFGKGLVQTVLPLEGNAAVLITTAKYLTPSGKDINRSREQRGGVDPDIKVEVTEQQFLSKQDPQLKKAIEVLKEQISARSPGGAGKPSAAAR